MKLEVVAPSLNTQH